MRAAQLNALRHHFDQRRRQHEPGAERDEVAQVRALPISLDDDGAAKDIRTRSGQPQQHADQDGGHEGKEYRKQSPLVSLPVPASYMRARIIHPSRERPSTNDNDRL